MWGCKVANTFVNVRKPRIYKDHIDQLYEVHLQSQSK